MEPSASNTHRTKPWTGPALAAIAGLMYYAAFPPLDLGPWAAVPALALWTWALLSAQGLRGTLARCVVAALAFNVPGFLWLRHVTVEGLVCTVLILTLYQLLYALALRAMRGLPAPVLAAGAAAAWASVEYLRSTLFFIAFPWLLAGHAFHAWTRTAQVVDLGGVWLLSWLAVYLGAGLAALAWDRCRGRGPSKALVLSLVLLPAAAALYGTVRMAGLDPRPGPVVGLVQCDVPQSLKQEGQSLDEIVAQHFRLTGRLLQQGPVDLVLWPETMVGYLAYQPEVVSALAELARRQRCHFLIGALHVQQKPERYHNSAFWMDTQGRLAGRYDKIRLVPVSEQLPFERSFPPLYRLLKSFLPEGFMPFTPGTEIPVFRVGEVGVAPDICFEVSFADHAREASRRGAQVLASISNDAWFQDGVELELARIQGSFRAMETRMAVLRAVNRGISSIIDPDGRVHDLTDGAGRRRGVAGVLRRAVLLSPAAGRTLYVRWGDWFAWLCLAVAAACLLAPALNPAWRTARVDTSGGCR